jgi:hypothetical protein
MPWRWSVLLPAVAGCIHTIDEHDSPIGAVIRDCVVAMPAGVASLDAPASLEYPDHSLWLWESVSLADGASVSGAAAAIADADAACAGPALIAGADGAPLSLLALTPDELAANASRTDGKRLALSPTGGVVANGVGFIFYDHVVRGPGFFDADVLGTGVCVLDAGATACRRVAASGSTLLWTPDELVVNRGGIVDGDRAVVAGCRAVAAFDDPCTLAGVPVASLTDPGAYQLWNAFSGWVDKLTSASAIADAPAQLTIARYDAGYLAISLDIFAARVQVARTSDATGAYGHATPAFDVVPASLFPSGGREHAALRPRAKSIAVSYATDGAAAPGLHLVTFGFYGDFQ